MLERLERKPHCATQQTESSCGVEGRGPRKSPSRKPARKHHPTGHPKFRDRPDERPWRPRGPPRRGVLEAIR